MRFARAGIVGIALGFAVGNASAEVKGCPAGQALQGVDFITRSLVCIPVVSAADVAALASRVATLETTAVSDRNARIAADNNLQAAINTEMSARLAGDTALQNAIKAETAAREAGDASALAAAKAYTDAAVAKEAAARQAADNAETIARIAEDGATLAAAKAYTDAKVASGGGGTSGPLGQMAVSASGTAAVTLSTLNSFFAIPGLALNINVPLDSVAVIATDGGILQTSATANVGSVVDVAVVVDGAHPELAAESFRRLVAANPSNLQGGFESWSVLASPALGPGLHTIQVVARLVAGSAVTVSGDGASALQGRLTVLVLRR